MSAPMKAFARCLEDGCSWKPDPTKLMQPQAEKHTNDQGHATEAGWARQGETK